MDPTALLRPGLLDGRAIALGGGAPFAAPLEALGAAVRLLAPTLDEEAAAAAATALVARDGALHALVHDLRPAFGAGGETGLRAALDAAWVTIRAAANAAWVQREEEGRVVVVAPPPSAADPHAGAARAAAENLARTLSIEWARHGIRTVAITPGAATDDGQLAALAAYLASPAGDYFSGARLALGEAGPAAAAPAGA